VKRRDFWTLAFRLLEKRKRILELCKLRIEIATMQDATKISVHDYLGFGEVDKPQIDAVELDFGVYVGERNSDGKPHGRGVAICYDGTIYMHYFDDG
jgi:hypothetical protein